MNAPIIENSLFGKKASAGPRIKMKKINQIIIANTKAQDKEYSTPSITLNIGLILDKKFPIPKIIFPA